jgi:hypothetical protein
MDPLIFGNLLSIGGKLIDRLIPDKAAADEAKLNFARMAQDGELKELEISMSAIVAEARSSDPWTSRARPSFLYVMYVMILTALPMGVLSVFRPDMAVQIAEGVKAWLTAIPDQLWWLFGAGYLGYTGVRSFVDKRQAERIAAAGK